jgi:hypothetical protein
MANAHLRDEDEIRKGIGRAQFVQKGKFLLWDYSESFGSEMKSNMWGMVEIEAL